MDWGWWVVIAWAVGTVILLGIWGFHDEDPFDDPDRLIVFGWPVLLVFGLVALPFIGVYKGMQYLGWKRSGY